MSRMLMGTSQVAEPFWKGTEEKVLRLQFCKDCGKAHHTPVISVRIATVITLSGKTFQVKALSTQ